jgi:putative ABC transport system permease protein
VPEMSRVLVRLLSKSKNPVVVMATNKLENSSLQINTNIIFIVTMSVALTVYSLFNYMMSVENAKEDMVKSDMYVAEYNGFNYDRTDELSKVENVKSVSTLYEFEVNYYYGFTEIELAGHTVQSTHLAYSNDYESLFRDSNIFDTDLSSFENLSKYEVVVSSYYKKMYKLNEGDIIVLNLKNELENFTFETPIRLKIVGFTDTSKIQNNTIVISSSLGEELSQYMFDGYYNVRYFLNLNDNSEREMTKVRKTIINELGVYSNGYRAAAVSKNGYIMVCKNDAYNYMRYMVILVLVVVLLALSGIINNQTVSFMERRRELATLYSVAMSRKQLKNMILIENLLSFIISTITSILFYLVIIKLVEYTLEVMLLTISVKFAISGVVVFLVGIALILFAIQASMRNHIKKMNVVEEIKYE